MNRIALIDQLIRHEGLVLTPYRDTQGKLTIGIGRNLDDRGIAESEARHMLANDIELAEAALDRHVPIWRSLTDARQRVLVDMCFNMGWPRLAGFKRMLAALWSRDYEAAAREMEASLWARQVGARAETLAAMMRKG